MIHNVTFTGTGATVTLAAAMTASGNYTASQADLMRPAWVQAVNETGGGTARMGDVNTTLTYGLAIPATAGMMLPPVHDPGHLYSTTSIYLYVPNGTVVDIMMDA